MLNLPLRTMHRRFAMVVRLASGGWNSSFRPRSGPLRSGHLRSRATPKNLRGAGRSARGSAPDGFTLLEMLLVLAIIATVGALAAPSFESMISSRKIKHNTETLALELAEARLEAIRTGQAQVFTAVVGGTNFSIEPWLDGYDQVNASAGATIQNSASGEWIQTDSSGESYASMASEEMSQSLDSGVQFYQVDNLLDSRNAAATETQSGAGPGGNALASSAGSGLSGESNPILFYPDGSSTTAKIQLIDDRGRRMIIEIRGVTGRINFYRAIGVDAASFSHQDESSQAVAP